MNPLVQTRHADGAGVAKQAESLEQPQHDRDDYHRIDDGFDRLGHGDVGVYQPEQDPHDDQDNYQRD